MNKLRPLFRLGFILVMFGVGALPVSAQDEAAEEASPRLESSLRFAHLDSDDGLVQNRIEAILQDHNGFMWFGTQGGLSRYDGYRFTNFQHEADNPNSLSNNHVRQLSEDSNGIIWIVTEGGGINRLDPTTETFTHFDRGPGTQRIIPGDRHFTLFQDSRGHLWFGGTAVFGLTDYDPLAQSAVTYFQDNRDPNALHGNGIHEIVEAAGQVFWIATESGISRYDLATETFTNYDLPVSREHHIVALLYNSDGNVWVGGSEGLYRYNAAEDNFEFYPIPSVVNDILEAEDGLLWLATQAGLYRFDRQTLQITGVDDAYAGIADSLSSNTLTNLYQSRSGLIWIGSNRGIDVYDPHTAQFDYYRHRIPGAPYSLAPGELQSIYVADDSTAWVGVDSVLHKIDLRSGEITLYPLEDYGLDAGDITTVLQDHAGIVWLTTLSGRLLQFDPDSQTFEAFPNLPRSGGQGGGPQGPPPRPSFPVALREDAQNRLWLAFEVGRIFRIDEDRQTVVAYDGPEGNPPPDVEMRPGQRILIPISNMSIARDGSLWLTTLNGIYRFDPTREEFHRYRPYALDESDPWIEASLEARDGIIWIASHDGLLRLDPQTEAMRAYTTADGLPTNYLVGILEDQAGDLWLSTKQGLSRFTPSTETFRNYTAADGLQGNEFLSRIFAQAPDGRMFFGGTHGLTAFYPQDITDSDYAPPVILDEFELFNQVVQPGDDSPLSRPIWLTDSITLDHTQNIISFEFAVLNYAFGNTNRYRYRLEGFEDHWNETDSSRRFVTYTNLPAGDYTFTVQGANRDGVWSSHEVALSLTILPPWWQTLWFRMLAVLTTAAVGFGAYRWRIRSIKQHNRELESEVERQTKALKARTNELLTSEAQLRQAKDAAEAANRAKTTFLANISHELRSPLNAILGFAQLSDRSPNLPTDVRDNLGIILHSGEHLLALINQVLDLSKIEAGQMTLDTVNFDLYRMLDELEDMFILAAEDKRLLLTFERSLDLPRYVNADVTKLRQALINLISNALKFTDRGAIVVRAQEVSSEAGQIRLKFEVADSGAGIPAEELPRLFDAFTQTSTGQKAQEGTGLGLAISRKIVRLMGGDITVSSEPGQGTTFTFDVLCRAADGEETQDERVQQPVIGLEPGQPTYRILVVDDKWTNRQLLVKLLTPLGFEVREAEDGQQALSAAQAFKPHLIWMDIRMPNMGGIEATQRLKALPEGESIVIIALTASIHDDEHVQTLNMGCDDLLRKPFRTADMFEMMGKHLGIRYVYDRDAQQPAIKEQVQMTPAEIEAELLALPPDLIRRLVEGIELGDVRMIDAVTVEINRHNAPLAETLSRLAQRFEFDTLLGILRETET